MVDPTTPGGAIAEQVIQALPPDVQALIKNPGKTSQRIQSAIRWASRPDQSVVRRHHQRNSAIETFADIQNARLRDMDAVARQIAHQFRRRAAVTGAATGLPGGLWAVVAAGADVQLTAIYAVRMVADIAQAYGYDTSATEEQAELADVLAVVAGVDGLRGVGNWLSREELARLVPDLLPRLLARMSVKITEEQAAKWVGRIIPGIGAAIGGSIDYTFLRIAGNRAIEHYHARFASEHGTALPAANAEPAALPAPTVGANATPAPNDAIAESTPADAASTANNGAAAALVTAPTAEQSVQANPSVPESSSVLAPAPAGAAEIVPQRSAGLAALLEFLIPGAGALYGGRAGVGVFWFLVSLLAGYVAFLQLAGPLGALGQGQLPASSTLPVWLPYFLGAAAIWLILRILLAVRYARSYARFHETRPPEAHLASQLAAFALLALLVTVGACAALGYIVYSAIASLIH